MLTQHAGFDAAMPLLQPGVCSPLLSEPAPEPGLEGEAGEAGWLCEACSQNRVPTRTPKEPEADAGSQGQERFLEPWLVTKGNCCVESCG